MKVLVCGQRTFSNAVRLCAVLDDFHKENKITTIIEGGANGADTIAFAWAVLNKVSSKTFGADWDKFKKRAGPLRNQQMIDEGKPDVVIAFFNDISKSKGTVDMIKRADKAGIPVHKFFDYESPLGI